MPELLLELFSEEIPARMQGRAAADLQGLVAERLKAAGLAFATAEAYATPRRLTLVVEGLPAAQPDTVEERRGPRADAPEQAVQGFLKAAGVRLDDCERRDTGKGVFLFATIRRSGRPTAAVLVGLLQDAVAALPWPKSMRWGSRPERWVRPLHAILCLFDGAVVPVAFAGLTAGDRTRGHRFHAPAPFAVTGFADYREKLQAARVLLDPAERRAAILAQAEARAREAGFVLERDEALLDELAGLVEWPVVVLGRIEERFLSLPPEVPVTSMRTHQKYLALRHPDGRLAPHFLAVANLEADDGGRAIVAGNERVLTARLSDAAYFWQTDRKQSLESRVPALANVVFHAKLGTLADKVSRLEALAAHLARYVPGAEPDRARAAARLAKADLTAGMVGEFPELQGVMGRYYALADGVDPTVAEALREHYSPLGPSDRCPTAPLSAVVALADKLDTLVGFFGIGELPTGSKDPFALRRAALGCIRLAVENGLRLPLLAAFGQAALLHGEARHGAGFDFQPRQLLGFFADRLKVHLREKGVRHDLVAAVFGAGEEDDLVRLLARVEALDGFLRGEDGANLLAAYRRAANILRIEEKKDGRRYDGAVDPALLSAAEERALDRALAAVTAEAEQAAAAERFQPAMRVLAGLRGPVDAFFDQVTVNAAEAEVRRNRLHLLSAIRRTLDRVADFSQIEG